MLQHEWLAAQFEADRDRLRGVAYRMLGSRSEADDAVQEAWLRLSRADAGSINNLSGWLTTVLARVCLDMLRTRKSRREDAIDDAAVRAQPITAIDPEHDAQLADSVGMAMLVVLEMLTPAERVAFVLHDMFDLPFDEIAPIVGRTPAAARQLASRARRRVQGTTNVAVDFERKRAIVDAFLAASRSGDFSALLALLDPEVVLRADAAAVQMGATDIVRGAKEVAGTFSGRAQAARAALIDGVPGLVWLRGGRPVVVFRFTIANNIVGIELIADTDHISQLELTIR